MRKAAAAAVGDGAPSGKKRKRKNEGGVTPDDGKDDQPSEGDLRAAVQCIVDDGDPDELTSDKVRFMLEETLKCSLNDSRNVFMKECFKVAMEEEKKKGKKGEGKGRGAGDEKAPEQGSSGAKSSLSSSSSSSSPSPASPLPPSMCFPPASSSSSSFSASSFNMSGATQLVAVKVPAGVVAGQKFPISLPGGNQFIISCPAEGHAGDTLHVEVPVGGKSSSTRSPGTFSQASEKQMGAKSAPKKAGCFLS